LVHANGITTHIPAGPAKQPLDPVGAGDTFIAVLTSVITAGALHNEAGIVANLAAAVTVEKLGQTGTASPDEIMLRYTRAVGLQI
jgi:bifunctional ADP-heptose synthase (sugar kinase/adenylyltransferase)